MIKKLVTIWSRFGKNKAGIEEFQHNHIEDDLSEVDVPKAIDDAQAQLWKGARWKREYGYLDEQNVLHRIDVVDEFTAARITKAVAEGRIEFEPGWDAHLTADDAVKAVAWDRIHNDEFECPWEIGEPRTNVDGRVRALMSPEEIGVMEIQFSGVLNDAQINRMFKVIQRSPQLLVLIESLLLNITPNMKTIEVDFGRALDIKRLLELIKEIRS
jgi:hypothetical protein